jgi:hypothetical protein
MGATLEDAVAAAAKAVKEKATATVAAGESWKLELDVTTSAEGTSVDDDRTTLRSVGTEGVLVTRDDGKTGFVLPSEVAQRSLFVRTKEISLDGQRIVSLLSERAGVPVSDLATMRAYRFETVARVESADLTRTLDVFRGMVSRSRSLAPDALVSATRRGADYLARVMNDQGRYVYMYHPVDDRADTAYGWLRHAGTTYALLQAYARLRDPSYLDKAKHALEALKHRMRDDPRSGGKYVIDTNDEEQQKVGGAGLALLAFVKHAEATGDTGELDTMRALALFIESAQYADGHFRANADVEHDTGKKLKREPIYYPGEATFALARLYALDPQPVYLETARKAADWIVRVRDAAVSEDNQEHDHWMAYALNELVRIRPDRAYVDHVFKIARAIVSKQHGPGQGPGPDAVGSFFEGESTPASTRLEALDSAIKLARFLHEPDAWLLDAAQKIAAFTLAQQFDQENAYFLKLPAKAEGGVRESLFNADIRIDYVQHAMSSWLELAALLEEAR